MKNLLGKRKKLTEEVVAGIRADYIAGMKWRDLQTKYQVSVRSIYRVLSGKVSVNPDPV